ncbi:MarR family transcriptional regulator [Haemophilus paracuniculus]|uniref:MarR family transcriptional regulator n=1 Tax=Haemophilus paracuniculus TaxID=734 RepID=A0A1T0AQ85_9PAST|nr:MarR family transcriptional regulator [Haemophilus paracuniculus]
MLNEFEKQINQIEEALDSWIEKWGLGYNHFAVLYSLASAEQGQCTQKQICDEWYLPKQTVFNICKAYKEKGWIEFYESPTDKRERLMRLTEQGKPHVLPIYHASEQLSERVFTKFGKKKTAQLFALLSELGELYREQIAETEVDSISEAQNQPN